MLGEKLKNKNRMPGNMEEDRNIRITTEIWQKDKNERDSVILVIYCGIISLKLVVCNHQRACQCQVCLLRVH